MQLLQKSTVMWQHRFLCAVCVMQGRGKEGAGVLYLCVCVFCATRARKYKQPLLSFLTQAGGGGGRGS